MQGEEIRQYLCYEEIEEIRNAHKGTGQKRNISFYLFSFVPSSLAKYVFLVLFWGRSKTFISKRLRAVKNYHFGGI